MLRPRAIAAARLRGIAEAGRRRWPGRSRGRPCRRRRWYTKRICGWWTLTKPSNGTVGGTSTSAAEAMRRILVHNSRKKRAKKRRADYHAGRNVPAPELSLDVVALDAALNDLSEKHPQKAHLVSLRYFAGCSLEEAAQILGISRATASGTGCSHAHGCLGG